jgi:hypothetical protein
MSKPRRTALWTTALFLLASAAAPASPPPTTGPAAVPGPAHRVVRLVWHDRTVDVQIDRQLFTTYHFGDDLVLPYTRPYFWPVRAPDGTELTDDQAQTIPTHPHQRSIWIGHGDVNGANHWKVTGKPLQPKQRHVDFRDVATDRFTEDLIWEDNDGQPMLGEVRTCRFIAYPDGPRGLDVSTRLTALAGDVTFGTGRDHGFFSIRFLPVLHDHAQFLNSAGTTDAAAIDGRADWCDECGQVDGTVHGGALFDAPGDPRHPPYWHTKGRLMPDVFGSEKGSKTNPPPDAGPITLRGGGTLAFHWRAVFHDGDAAAAAIADKYHAFADGQ